MGKPQFRKGMVVEVCSDDQGLRGAWFIATILRSLPRKKRVLVEYHTLTAEKSTKPLKELVDVVNIRPVAPREAARSFSTSDEVDAAHNDGWWEGVVIRVLDNHRYLVYFRTGKEEHVFQRSELRIHREWVHGNWVPPIMEGEEAYRSHSEGNNVKEKVIENENTEEEVANQGAKGEEEHNSDLKAREEKVEETKEDKEEAVDVEDEVNANAMEEKEEGDAEATEDMADHQQDIDVEHIQIGVRNDQAQLPLVHSTADIANKENSIEEMERPCSNSNNSMKIQPTCEKLNEGEAALNCSSIIGPNEQAVDSPPTTEGEEDPLQKKEMCHTSTGISSSPAKVLTDNLKTNCCQLNCDLSGIYPTTDEIGPSPPFDNEGEECDLSDTHVPDSQESLVVQEASDQQPWAETGSTCLGMVSCGEQQCENQQALEQNIPTKKKRKGPQRRILVEPFIPSEDPQQCRRTGKGWRCTVMAFPGKRYCEKHDVEQNTRNVKRRKRPVDQTRGVMELFVPSDPQQCRRTGKGWRCHQMASSGKRYCDKHQMEQNIHNEKRRKRRRESSCVVSNGCDKKSNSHSDHLISSDHLLCGVVDMDTQCNQGNSGNVDDAHTLEIGNNAVSNEPNAGDAGRNDPAHLTFGNSVACIEPDQGDIERTDCVHVLEVDCTAVNIKPNHGDSTKGDQKQVDDTAVSGESNICDAGKTHQAQVTRVGSTVRIDVASDSNTRKRKMGEFFDEFWSVFIT